MCKCKKNKYFYHFLVVHVPYFEVLTDMGKVRLPPTPVLSLAASGLAGTGSER